MFEDVINHYIQEEQGLDTLITLSVKAKGTALDKLRSILEQNGFEVVNQEVATKLPNKQNIGKQITTVFPVVVARDVTIKTPLSLYRIAKVILPKDSIGTITAIENNKYVVNFDSDIKIDPYDVIEGNLSNIPSYQFSECSLAPEKVNIL